MRKRYYPDCAATGKKNIWGVTLYIVDKERGIQHAYVRLPAYCRSPLNSYYDILKQLGLYYVDYAKEDDCGAVWGFTWNALSKSCVKRRLRKLALALLVLDSMPGLAVPDFRNIPSKRLKWYNFVVEQLWLHFDLV